MKGLAITAFVITVLTAILPPSASSSPWGRKKGEFFAAPQIYYYTADHYWDKEGDRKSIGCTFKKLETAIYAEWGLSQELTLTLRVPYQHLECGEKHTDGISDIEAGLIKRLKQSSRGVLSLQATAIIPTGYSISRELRLGYNRFGLEGMLLGGYGFNRAFAEAGIGYRYYQGYPSDQIRGYARIGLKPDRKIIIMNTIDIQYGVNNGERKKVGKNITLEPYYRLIQNDFSLVFRITPRISVNLGVIKALWGRNTGDGINFYGQLWFTF